MQLYEYDTSHGGTHRQVGGRSVDPALFVEELVEIYSTPTPKDWREAKKSNCIGRLFVFFTRSRGYIFIPCSNDPDELRT